MICENCGNHHDGNYGSGRFCCKKCARAFSSKYVTEEGRKKQKAVLNNKENRNKAHEAMLKNSQNYELDGNGNWNKIQKPKTHKFNNTKDQHTHSSILGKIGELATAQKFLSHGYNVYIPLIDNNGVDMMVEKDDGPKKIQVKSSSQSSNNDANSTHFSLKSNTSTTKNNVVVSRSKTYNKNSVDYFALYSENDNDIYLIENDESQSSITIRTKLSENNTVTKGKNLEKIHKAEDYQIDKVLDNIDNNIKQSDIFEVTNFVEK